MYLLSRKGKSIFKRKDGRYIKEYINKLNDDLINNYLNKLLCSGRKDNKGGLSKNYVYVIRCILS